MTSFIQPHDAIFANYHSLLSLPVIRTLQEENDQLRRENARLRNVLLSSLEKQVPIADPEVRFILPFGPVPSGSSGRLSERLPTVQRTVPNEVPNEVPNAVPNTVLSTAKSVLSTPVLSTPVLDPALESLQRVYVKTEKMPPVPVVVKSANASVVSVKAQVSIKEEEFPPTPFVVVSDEEEGSVRFQDSVVEDSSVVEEEVVAAVVQPTVVVNEAGVEEEVVEDDDGEGLDEVVIDGKTYYVEELTQGADVYDDESETVGTLMVSNGFAVDVSLPEVSGDEELASELEPKEDIEGTTWFVDGLLNAYHALEDEEVGEYAGRWVERVVYALQGDKAEEAKPEEAKPAAEVAAPADDDDVEETEIDGKKYFVSNGGAEGCRVYNRISEEEVGDLIGNLREGVLVLA
jgi:hypothetical protein